MTVIITGVLGLLGALATGVLGYLSGPNRHLKRLTETNEVLKALDPDTDRAKTLAQALDFDALRYYHKLFEGGDRRYDWFSLVVITAFVVFSGFAFNATSDPEGRQETILHYVVAVAAFIASCFGGWLTARILNRSDRAAQIAFNKARNNSNPPPP